LSLLYTHGEAGTLKTKIMADSAKWKSIPGYDKYEIDSCGNVKSMYGKSPSILKAKTDKGGYYGVSLTRDGKSTSFRNHQLVAMSFLGHVPDKTYRLVVDHINHDRKDNRVENLRIVSQRENSNMKHLKSSSQYTGVSLEKTSGRWKSVIGINKKVITIGRYTTEIEAHNAYVAKLNSLKN
jgi:hypothetical protein